MRIVLLAVICSMCFIAAPVVAGPGHDHDHGHAHHEVSAPDVSLRAMKKVNQLAESNKIDASWSGLSPAFVEQKTFAKGPEWVVMFKNESIADESKQTLYIFYTLDGHYLAANYTGN